MAPDEYSTGGGGKLKLKGSKVSDGRVDKKKKKKAKKEKEKETDAEQAEAEKSQRQESREADSAERAVSRERDEDGGSGSSAAKTEAERKYEEIRRKRVCLTFYFCGVVGLNGERAFMRSRRRANLDLPVT
jgi:protein FAM32A